MKKMRDGGYMQHAQLVAALEARYPKREYAFLMEVRNGTGLPGYVRQSYHHLEQECAATERAVHVQSEESRRFRDGSLTAADSDAETEVPA